MRRLSLILGLIGAAVMLLSGIPPAWGIGYPLATRQHEVAATSSNPSRSLGTGPSFCALNAPFGFGAKPLKTSTNFDNVYPCGPTPNDSTTPENFGVPSSDPYFSFFENPDNTGKGEAGFQCVELANRFVWVADGILPIRGANLTGADYVNTEVSLGRVSSAQRYYNSTESTTHHPYLPGDIVSFTGGTDGHVAVVIQSTFTGTGSYSVTLMEENASNTGKTTAQVTNWKMAPPADSPLLIPYDFIGLTTAPY